MAIIVTQEPSSICFGFLDENFDSYSPCKSLLSNSSKIYGYCPFLGSMIGVNNIYTAIMGLKQKNKTLVVQLTPAQRLLLGIRGSVEFFSMGALWLPVDALATVVQGVAKSPQGKKHIL